MTRHRSKHTKARSHSPLGTTVRDEIHRVACALARHPLVYGHGTETPFDEAAALVIAACGYRHEDAPQVYAAEVSAAAKGRLQEWLHQRIHERIPSAYLTQMSSFAGEWYVCDPRALIPRSPLAEIIQERLSPFVDASKVKRVLDIGTGSGCIAIAMAKAFPDALVDAVDVSEEALRLAQLNATRLGVSDRVRCLTSDVYRALNGQRYDVIISNPPYVPRAVVDALSPEYAHEPRLGLVAGEDGLSVVNAILKDAHQHLNPQGVLVVEVGETADTLARHYPTLPFLWLSFQNGGDGVFLLNREHCPHGG
jgi:ribosomal protein L3 glutamine methyltransferase